MADNLARCYVSLVTVVMHFKGVDHILAPPDYDGSQYKWIDEKVSEILLEQREKEE